MRSEQIRTTIEAEIHGIAGKDYVRQRLEPKPGDPDYLHLSDLLAAITPFGSSERLLILDYGCGGSPYRALFPNAEYRRADFAAIEDLDYVIAEDSRIEETDETFDLILSTQVAEHVVQPQTYFAECFRLLKAGGLLVCAAPGTYPDHGCPYDFQRWTIDGLRRDLAAAGFSIEDAYKLTTNARGMMYLLQRFSGWFETSGFSSPLFRIFRSLMHRSSSRWQRFADKAFSKNRIASDGSEFYIGLLIAARKEG